MGNKAEWKYMLERQGEGRSNEIRDETHSKGRKWELHVRETRRGVTR